LKVYGSGTEQIAVVQAGHFRFYINSFPRGVPAVEEGDSVEGSGRLLLDHYIWVEFLSSYPDPPDLFYQLWVTRIRSVRIPESFVTRREKGKSYPASLGHEEYSAGSTEVVKRMDDTKGDEVFFLVDFDDRNVGETKVPPTFLGA